MNSMISNSTPLVNQQQHHPIEDGSPYSLFTGEMNRLLEYNITKLTANNLKVHRFKLLQLSDFARLSRIQINFIGLTELQEIYSPHNCNNWFSSKDYHPECDLVQILSAIQSQSISSPRKYNIRLVY